MDDNALLPGLSTYLRRGTGLDTAMNWTANLPMVPEQRGTVVPGLIPRHVAGEHPKPELAWPGLLHDPYMGLNRLLQSGADERAGMPTNDRQNAADAFDASGLAMMGGFAVPKPSGAVGSAGGKLATELGRAGDHLPMDQASRLARAREMGFDTETPYYHGTKFDFKEPNKRLFVSDRPEEANWYAAPDAHRDLTDTNGAMVYKTFIRGNFFDARNMSDAARKSVESSWSKGFRDRINAASQAEHANWQLLEHPSVEKWVRENGYAGMVVREGGKDNRMVFDPSNIRSVNAAFDPAKSSSANLLAANPETSAAVPLATQGNNDDGSANALMRRYGIFGGLLP